MFELSQVITAALDGKRRKLQQRFDADILSYYGDIRVEYLAYFRRALEIVQASNPKRERLAIVLNTSGGSVEAVEQMVSMIRHFYKEVYFIVPHIAMSAGTIFCMSGNKIYMDYSSALGPIDPQLQNKEGHWVPALGYLDKFEEFVDKSKQGLLSPVEYAIAQSQDLALLRRFEQARDLSVSLLKQWLIEYKFSDWTVHRTHEIGQVVTQVQKEVRANEIARQLGDNKVWHSHGRMIGIEVLRNKLLLEIEDYSADSNLRMLINGYHDLLSEHLQGKPWPVFFDGQGVN